MPDMKCNDSASVYVLPVVMPSPATPSLDEWHGRGLCVGEDPDVFFPSHDDSGTQARQICAACTVRDDCPGYAIGADEFGVWGSLDQDKRRKLRRVPCPGPHRCRRPAPGRPLSTGMTTASSASRRSARCSASAALPRTSDLTCLMMPSAAQARGGSRPWSPGRAEDGRERPGTVLAAGYAR
jgi:Transcription factor WhiB